MLIKKLNLALGALLLLTSFHTRSIPVNAATATSTATITILPGELTVNPPSLSIGPKISSNTYNANLSEMTINDYQGTKSDYKIGLQLEVYDQDGKLRKEPSLTANTILITKDKRHPDFYPVVLNSGEYSTIVANNYKTWSGEYILKFDNVVLSRIEKNDRIVLVSDRIIGP